jgi:hypothetical protein
MFTAVRTSKPTYIILGEHKVCIGTVGMKITQDAYTGVFKDFVRFFGVILNYSDCNYVRIN